MQQSITKTTPNYKEEQAKAIYHDKGNLLVSASAGSGKTFVMIERLINLIVSGKATVNDIVAVTFTEKSALEMKERLTKALLDKISEGQTQLQSQLLDLPTCQISTIHSFCSRLVRTYFFVAGVSQDFRVLDGVQASIIQQTALDKTFKYFYDNNDEDFYSLLTYHVRRNSDKPLKELILKLFNYAEEEAYPLEFYDRYLTSYSDDSFNNLLTEVKNQLDKTLSKGVKEIEKAKVLFENNNRTKSVKLLNAISSSFKSVISNNLKAVVNFIRIRKDYDGKLDDNELMQKELINENIVKCEKQIDKVIKLIQNYDTLYLEFVNQKQHVAKLSKILKKYREVYIQEKLDENALDFSDLQHFALKVLENEDVKKEVQSKYKYVFIDEYQDTNSIQEEIMSKISFDNLFMVGDVKQSIYGFRGCRSDFFEEKYKKYKETNQVVDLNDNFRSAKNVIDFVNYIFDYCMTENFFGIDYKKTSRLIFGGKFLSGEDGRANFHFIPTQKEEQEVEQARIYDIKEELLGETDLPSKTAELIDQIIRKEIGDIKATKNGQPLDIDYKDIAILVRSTTGDAIKNMQTQLIRRGVPVSSVIEQSVCGFPEIDILINLLKLLDCFNQDVALCTVMLSPIGRFTEEELSKVVLKARELGVTKHDNFYLAVQKYCNEVDDKLSKKLVNFKNYIDKTRKLADFYGALKTLTTVITDSNFENVLLASPMGDSKVKRVKYFLSKAKVDGKYLTVREFLTLIESCPKAFNYTTVCDENTVKLMTIHASKGLEFPVVIVCNVQKGFNDSDLKNEVLLDRDYGYIVKDYDLNSKRYKENIFREVVKDKMRQNLVKEEMRLFYVALTRATYSLHVICESEKSLEQVEFTDAKSQMDFLPPEIELSQNTDLDIGQSEGAITAGFAIINDGDKQLISEIAQNLRYKYPYEKDLTLPLKTSVSKVKSQMESDDNAIVMFDETQEFTNTENGIIAHTIMQYYDFDNADFDYQIDKMLEDNIVSREQLSLLNLDRLKRVVENDIIKNLKGKKLYREKYFLSQIESDMLFDNGNSESVMVQGIIDLLVVEDDGATIIDYKYSKKKEEQLIKDYSLQLNVYAKAVEKILNKRIKEKLIINLFSGESITL